MPGSIGLYLRLAAVVGIFLAGAVTTHRFDEGEIQKMKAGYAIAQVNALEAARLQQQEDDLVTNNAAKREAAAALASAAQARRTLAEVQSHVHKVPTGCITWGFVRVLDARVHGVEASALALPPGKSDDACTGVGSAVLADSIVGNYGLSADNSRQLNSLIDVTKELAAARKK